MKDEKKVKGKIYKCITAIINRCYLAQYNFTKWLYNFRHSVGCKIHHTEYYDEILKPSQYKRELKVWYYLIMREKLDLKNPVTYTQKIQYFKLYGVSPYITMLADKVAVRKWVEGKIGQEYLTACLGVWKSFDDIDFDKLSNRFILKCNHGAGYNEVIQNKEQIDRRELKEKFDRWMRINYAYIGGLELQYKDIRPQIIAEEYLENLEGGDLFDYKFWCFGGKVEFIMFLSGRNKKLCMNNYDKEWNLLPFTYGGHENSEKVIERPKELDKMIELAEILADGFPHVRVDLYLLNDGTIKFGEMTFTSFSGVMRWSDKNINFRLGELIDCSLWAEMLEKK